MTYCICLYLIGTFLLFRDVLWQLSSNYISNRTAMAALINLCANFGIVAFVLRVNSYTAVYQIALSLVYMRLRTNNVELLAFFQ